ncbi:DUF3360 domain-containing protein [Vibrio chagasii]|nr:DUF3360 domain-containing protein [Vibrio chagasii]
MKPRRFGLNLPGRDFRFELEDLCSCTGWYHWYHRDVLCSNDVFGLEGPTQACRSMQTLVKTLRLKKLV